jgi:hypothetical protein
LAQPVEADEHDGETSRVWPLAIEILGFRRGLGKKRANVALKTSAAKDLGTLSTSLQSEYPRYRRRSF